MIAHTLKRDQEETIESTPSVFKVAAYFLYKSQNDLRPNTSITHLKLQKLVYYAQAWHLAILGKRLFNERLEAWVHGPASPDLYRTYRPYGYQVITAYIHNSDVQGFSKQSLMVLDGVWQIYGDKDAKELEKLTHSEEPWLRARQDVAPDVSSDNEIYIEDMKSYYSKYLKRD
ncbi:Panacea domain-containing protein [Bacillus mycoides]|uniref:Panacea domain-containing protein n=1 Tax=Bacillus mycoides TaxID=1405 RepID=UPI002E1DED6A|nr:DUF4065 domain-containing protein [Bacillus mycoides]